MTQAEIVALIESSIRAKVAVSSILKSEVSDRMEEILQFAVDNAGGGSASRFGIEDNTGVQNRVVNMGERTIDITCVAEGGFYTTFHQDFEALNLISVYESGVRNILSMPTLYATTITQENPSPLGGAAPEDVLILALTTTNSTVTQNIQSRIAFNLPYDTGSGAGEIIAGHIGLNISNVSVGTQASEFHISRLEAGSLVDYILPLSVNGNFADASGDITVSGGGGSATASNGLSIDGGSGDVILGGSLTANTTISAVSIITLDITTLAGTRINTGGFSGISHSTLDMTSTNVSSLSSQGNTTNKASISVSASVSAGGASTFLKGESSTSIHTINIADDAITFQPYIVSILKLFITGLPNGYANNTAALAGGLTVNQVYRNGDILQIVH